MAADHQHPAPGQGGERFGAPPRPGHRRRRLGQRNAHEEARAGPRRALDPDPAAHPVDQLFADRQPQPGAAGVAPGAIIYLGKALKDQLRLVERDADSGVADHELQLADAAPAGRRGHFARLDADMAAVGELDRVAHQVHQHLAQPVGVAARPLRQPGIEIDAHLQALGGGSGAQQGDDAADHLLDRKILLLELQRPGLQFGKIEEIVDQRQQGLAR